MKTENWFWKPWCRRQMLEDCRLIKIRSRVQTVLAMEILSPLCISIISIINKSIMHFIITAYSILVFILWIFIFSIFWSCAIYSSRLFKLKCCKSYSWVSPLVQNSLFQLMLCHTLEPVISLGESVKTKSKEILCFFSTCCCLLYLMLCPGTYIYNNEAFVTSNRWITFTNLQLCVSFLLWFTGIMILKTSIIGHKPHIQFYVLFNQNLKTCVKEMLPHNVVPRWIINIFLLYKPPV